MRSGNKSGILEIIKRDAIEFYYKIHNEILLFLFYMKYEHNFLEHFSAGTSNDQILIVLVVIFCISSIGYNICSRRLFK